MPAAGRVAIRRRREARDPWADVTARQFADVAGLAKGLIAAGMQAGDRVALLSRTRYEWTVADYAIWPAGAITVPIYETSSAEQVEWILGDSGARALIAETAGPPAGQQRGAGPAAQRGTDLADRGPGRRGCGQQLDSLAAEGAEISDDELAGRRAARQAADLATIIYTSGTTGRAQGLPAQPPNLLADVRNSIRARCRRSSPSPAGRPCCSCRWRTPSPGSSRSAASNPARAGAHRGCRHLVERPGQFQPAFILAVPRVFEKVYNGASCRPRPAG